MYICIFSDKTRDFEGLWYNSGHPGRLLDLQTQAPMEHHPERFHLSPPAAQQDSSVTPESTHFSIEEGAPSACLSLAESEPVLSLSEHNIPELLLEHPGSTTHISEESNYGRGTTSRLHAIAIGDQEYDYLDLENRDVREPTRARPE